MSDEIFRAKRIDKVCDAFEAACLEGRRPQRDEFLEQVPLEDRSALARELEILESHYHVWIDAGPETIPLGTSGDGAAGRAPSVGNPVAILANSNTYEIFEQLAHGGMGAVYRGHAAELRRDVAVKILLERHQQDPELVRRFVEEAQIGGQLQHPGIAPVYGVGTGVDGRPYIAMKLVKGETLAKLLADRKDASEDRPRFCKWFEQICETLAYAHSRRVIHRDLKPSNVMVGAFGEVQVMDWGLAKVLPETQTPATATDVSVVCTARSGDGSTATSHTQFGSVLGTLAYMAPEQALGEVQNVDRRTDVFGLGAILCEILTGRPPYVAPDAEQLRRKAARADLKDAYERLDGCGADAELIALAKRALAPEAADRPPDAGYLAAHLVAHRERMELRLRQAELARVQAESRSAAERARRKLTLAFSSALLTVLAVGVLGTLWGMIRAANARESLRRELYVSDLQLAQQMWDSADGTAKNVADLLSRSVPAKGAEDLREFAWRLQWTELERNARVLRGHVGGARLCDFGADGRLLTLDEPSTLRSWTASDLKPFKELVLTGAANVSFRALARDARTVVLATGRQVLVFDLQTGERRHAFSGTSAAIGVSLSADGRRIAVAWEDGRLEIRDGESGREVSRLAVRKPELLRGVEWIALNAAGTAVFLPDFPEAGRMTRLEIGGEETDFPSTLRSSVYSIAFSPDGKWRAAGDANGQVCLVDADRPDDDGSVLRAHRCAVAALGFSHDGEQLATGGAEGTVTVWNVARRERITVLKGHRGRIHHVAFAPDGKALASASADGTTRVWDLTRNHASRVVGDRALPVFSLDFSPDGRRLAAGTGSGTDEPGGIIEVWDLTTGESLTTITAAQGRTTALAFLPGGKSLIAGGYDAQLCVWDAVSGRELGRMENAADPRPVRESALAALAVSPDGEFVAAGFGQSTYHQSDYEQTAKVWNLATGDLVATLRGHKNSIGDVAFSRDGTLLATASDDQSVKLWSVKEWRPVRTLTGNERVKSAAFSADGRRLATGGASGVVTLWQVADGKRLQELQGHADGVFRLRYSPDGRTLATAGWDGTVKLWDPVSGRELRTLRDHSEWISSLAFHPDGNTLATGSFDASVRLWEAAPIADIDAADGEAGN